MEYRVIGRDGEVRWVRSQGKAFVGAAGKPTLVTGSLTDVTDGKRAQAALLESEKRYERAMLAADAGFWDWDVVADKFHASPKLIEIAGLPPGSEFADRAEFMARVRFHPDDRVKYESAVKELFATGGTRLTMEVRSIHGETRWNLMSGICVRDATGKVLRWTGSVTDISDRKRAENALRRSDQRYALAMEAASDGYTDWDFVTGEFYISPRLLEIVGHPPDAIFIDRDDWVRRFPFHPEDRKRWEAAVATLFAGRDAKLKMDLRIIVDGETRWTAFNFIATRDAAGKVVRWTGSIADINDAKRDVATVVESIPGLVAILTPDGEVDAVNDQLAEYCGQPLEAIKLWGTNGTVHAEDLPGVTEIFMRGISTGEPYEFEARVRRFDGVYRWNQIRGHPSRDSDGRIVRWYSVIFDIDDRKRAEQALREQTERLQLGQAAMRMIIMDWNVAEDVLTWSDSPEWLRGPMPASRGYPVFKHQVYSEDRDTFLATRRRALETLQVQTTEFRVLRTDGELIWVLERKQAFAGADGKAVRMLSAMFDITDRKRAEEAQRLSEQRYALAVAGANDGIWDWDLLTNRMFVSERGQGIFGLEPGPTSAFAKNGTP
jgi:PAS domain S-box-containing protein